MRRLALALLLIAGCTKEPPPRERALLEVKRYIAQNLEALHDAAAALQADAPAPAPDGWNAARDAQALARMRDDWRRARTAYEHVEGAIAVLFPELDFSTDGRYDGFLQLGPDVYLFDDEGVTGIHAVERILWSDRIPRRVVEFEQGLPGYVPAAFPRNAREARDFKERLCVRLVRDVDAMRAQFGPLALDPSAAFRGVIGSMKEQQEKAEKAASGEEESRYAQYTLEDMRANIAAGEATYAAFRPWLLGQPSGQELDAQIRAGFSRIARAYAAQAGEALPAVPASWSAQAPRPEDLRTPFGQLWSRVRDEADPEHPGTLVHALETSAAQLGIPVVR